MGVTGATGIATALGSQRMVQELGAAATSVRIRLPDERLRSFATFYYFVDCAAPLEDFLYPEWGNVRFVTEGRWSVSLGSHYPDPPPAASLFGATDRAARLTCNGGALTGFGLTPLGWQRLIGGPADRLANRLVPLDDALGRPQAELLAAVAAAAGDDDATAAIFDTLLLDRLAQTGVNPDWAIHLDHNLRERPHDVEHFATCVGVASRTLARMCRRVYGFSSKRLLRRQRFLATLGQMRVNEQRHYVSLIDPEYFDQAHFVREFREFMGLSPTAFLSADRPLMGQAALVQLAQGIPLSFALPPAPVG